MTRFTKKKAQHLCHEHGLKTGDVLWCGGERYVFDDFGGVDDGNPWVVAYKMLDGGHMSGVASRLCVWRRVPGGKIEPQSMVDSGESCYCMRKAVC